MLLLLPMSTTISALSCELLAHVLRCVPSMELLYVETLVSKPWHALVHSAHPDIQ